MEHEVPNYARHQCSTVKVKVKFTLQQAVKAEKGKSSTALLFL
jgi:hypothetical protein